MIHVSIEILYINRSNNKKKEKATEMNTNANTHTLTKSHTFDEQKKKRDTAMTVKYSMYICILYCVNFAHANFSIINLSNALTDFYFHCCEFISKYYFFFFSRLLSLSNSSIISKLILSILFFRAFTIGLSI